jgi:RNA polymerase-binding transcription factor DksA
MSGHGEGREKHSEKWLAELEIEACREELEALFLQEKEALEARRSEILERLDLMEQNTLAEVEAEKALADKRRQEILASLKDHLDKRYEEFILRLNAEDRVTELAGECMEMLLPKPTQNRGGSV